VIAVTAFTDEETVKTAKKAGIKQVINKPVSYDLLKVVIR
jgi:response regulator of citrate/malate metabolism